MALPKYTPDMFIKDELNISSILRISKFVNIPDNELPSVNVDGITFKLNANLPDADVATYFLNQYPKNDSMIFYCIYMSIGELILNHKKLLIKNKLIRKCEINSIEISKPMIEIILSSFKYIDGIMDISDKYPLFIKSLIKANMIKPTHFSTNSGISHNSIILPKLPTSKYLINGHLDANSIIKDTKVYLSKINKRV